MLEHSHETGHNDMKNMSLLSNIFAKKCNINGFPPSNSTDGTQEFKIEPGEHIKKKTGTKTRGNIAEANDVKIGPTIPPKQGPSDANRQVDRHEEWTTDGHIHSGTQNSEPGTTTVIFPDVNDHETYRRVSEPVKSGSAFDAETVPSVFPRTVLLRQTKDIKMHIDLKDLAFIAHHHRWTALPLVAKFDLWPK